VTGPQIVSGGMTCRAWVAQSTQRKIISRAFFREDTEDRYSDRRGRREERSVKSVQLNWPLANFLKVPF
jgi:hypothetical protein